MDVDINKTGEISSVVRTPILHIGSSSSILLFRIIFVKLDFICFYFKNFNNLTYLNNLFLMFTNKGV